MSARPTTSNADEWQLWLEEHADSDRGFIAVQIVEAIEEHQRALAREVYRLAEDTADKCETDATDFARGRKHEAKSIARTINAIMPYSRDPAALERLDCQGVKGVPFTHLFISRQGEPVYCARCGVLEVEYKKKNRAASGAIGEAEAITENGVHKVAEAMMVADWDASGEGRPDDRNIKHYYLMARAAIEAMEMDPNK